MRKDILETIMREIELPADARLKAESRYKDLGEWLNRPGSTLRQYRPYVFPQGSFLLQTAIRPYAKKDEYDLDICCKFLNGLTVENITQKSLREKLRVELEAYREARNIRYELEEKKRCWRLLYQDNICFHIDILPCLPERMIDFSLYGESYVPMYRKGELILNEKNSKNWRDLSLLITDNENDGYNRICADWHHSNPEGFARWFMARASQVLTKEVYDMGVRNEVADLPAPVTPTILHKIVKLLKRHRDVWFETAPKYKPISIIISRLAAEAYNGEKDFGRAMLQVLNAMGCQLSQIGTEITNPTEVRENYADKWHDDPLYHDRFVQWLTQALRDFSDLTSDNLDIRLAEYKLKRFGMTFGAEFQKLPFKEEQISHPERVNFTGLTPKPWYQ